MSVHPEAMFVTVGVGHRSDSEGRVVLSANVGHLIMTPELARFVVQQLLLAIDFIEKNPVCDPVQVDGKVA